MQARMRKSSSLAVMKIDFNPTQFTVGESRIPNLFSYPESKRLSTCETNKISVAKEIEHLRSLNLQYLKENQRLKKEIESLRNTLAAQTLASNTQPKTKQYYKDILQQSRCNSRIPTECETEVLSSKEESLQHPQNGVEEYFRKFSSRGFHANLNEFQELTKRYFKQYEQTYSKLSYMLGKVMSQETKWKELKELIEIYKVPLVYTKNPRLLLKQLSRQKSVTKKPGEVCLEMISPEETIKNFQGLLKKLQRSSRIMGNLKNNEMVKCFLRKCLGC